MQNTEKNGPDRNCNLIDSVINSSGEPLSPEIRKFMEEKLPQNIRCITLDKVEYHNKFQKFILISAMDEYELEAEQIADELVSLELSPSATLSSQIYDLSKVRIHIDEQAARAAKDLNARAFTCGNHIIFADGEYSPDNIVGQRLLAHELVHTIQQRGVPVHIVQCAEVDTAAFIRSGAKLFDSAIDVNKRINQALIKARSAAKGDTELLIDLFHKELGWNSRTSIGRTKIEVWADTLGRHKTYLPPQKTTKYAGVRYRLWLQSNSLFSVLNPTMLINGVYVGSDKLGHFLQQGYEYYRVNKKRGVGAAEFDGIKGELTYYGIQTTGVFSYADLEANRQGLKFYKDLAANPNMFFDISNYINKNWNEGSNPNRYAESVGKSVWSNLLNGKRWVGTLKDRGVSSQVTAQLKVANDVDLSGEFSYTQGNAGMVAGKIFNGKIVHLKSTDDIIRGVRIDFEWQLNPPAGSKQLKTGRGYWESSGESLLIGKWGWEKKNQGHGDWRLSNTK